MSDPKARGSKIQSDVAADHAPARHDARDSSTERATSAAIPGESETKARQPKAAKGPNSEDLPTLGELDGTFYFLKHLTGDGDVPDATHEDNKVEVCRMALNNGWRADEDTFRVHQAARDETGQGWNVHYAVDVVRNEVQE